MKYLLPIVVLIFLSCGSSKSSSAHEQNMITQNKRMTIYDQNSRDKQQHIRSSNQSKSKKIKKARKTKRYIR
jgi:hypothetical protein